jgi:hypothetical protein
MQATNLPGQKNVRRNVGQGGVVSLSTKPKQESTFKSTGRGRGSNCPEIMEHKHDLDPPLEGGQYKWRGIEQLEMRSSCPQEN